jgi:hypothetical protein
LKKINFTLDSTKFPEPGLILLKLDGHPDGETGSADPDKTGNEESRIFTVGPPATDPPRWPAKGNLSARLGFRRFIVKTT